MGFRSAAIRTAFGVWETEGMRSTVPTSVLPAHEARRLWEVARSDSSPEARFRELEAERRAGRPLQYLEGTAPFGPLDVIVDERVLVPRPETEQLWELARTLVDDPAMIVDLGTGSGVLALALARSHPRARVIGVDRSPAALDVARLNGDRLHIEADWRLGDLWDPLEAELQGSIDLVVSNPPYLAEHEWETVPADVRQEPRAALVAGPTGLEVLERIAAGSGRWLGPGGSLACEIGETQGAACRDLFGRYLEDVEISRDLAGRDRFVTGRRR